LVFRHSYWEKHVYTNARRPERESERTYPHTQTYTGKGGRGGGGKEEAEQPNGRRSKGRTRWNKEIMKHTHAQSEKYFSNTKKKQESYQLFRHTLN